MALSTVHPTLEITFSEEADALRFVVAGDLDRDNAWALTAAMIRSEPVRTSRLLLDLHELRFIDAGGLRALTDVSRRARRQGRRLAIVNPPEPIARLLRLTGLDQTLDIVA
jgi:anti-sigma B factor antagonist